MESKHSLSLSTAPPLQNILHYRQLVGKLLYLTISRPDLAYPAYILSQFLNKPTEDHLKAVHIVLRQIKGAPAQGIYFSANSDLQLKAFCDADWAACPVTRRSISGFCIMLAVIYWKCMKHHVVSRSSAESEDMSMASTCSELVSLARLLSDMGVWLFRRMFL